MYYLQAAGGAWLVAAGQRVKGLRIGAELGAPYERSAWLHAGAPGVGVSTLAKKVLAFEHGLHMRFGACQEIGRAHV